MRDSDATVIFSIREELTGGSLATLNFAQKDEKPWIYLSAAKNDDAPKRLHKFIEDNHIRRLNVAGPRASKEPEVGRFVTAMLHRLFNPALIYLVQGHDWAELLKAEIERDIMPQCMVRPFSDPKEALQSFVSESCTPDLLITGFLFRGMSGIELLQECKKLKPSLKVMIFAITPQTHIEAVLGNSPIRPDAVVQKGIDFDPFWAATRELLRFKWPND